MKTFNDYLQTGIEFHGHKCPAMPLGLRAGLAAMKVLGVERARNKELVVEAETGKGHAAGCFLDGIMMATGFTYGKSNIRKLYYNKLGFTLIEAASGRAVRVSIKADFFEKALHSPFVDRRRQGIEPQDIEPEVIDPILDNIAHLEDEQFLDIGKITRVERPKAKGTFEIRRCARCGEATFVNRLRVKDDGALVCIPCSGYGA